VASDAFDEDGLVQAKRLLDEIEAGLPMRPGEDGRPIVGDLQTARLLRVMRILADQLEELRSRD
jgi:hypothetical protein